MSTTQTAETQDQSNEIDYYYTNFKGDHLQSIDPKEKSFETKNGKVSYKEIPLQYNYGTQESPIIDTCFFEGPILKCYGGINTKREDKPALKEGDPPYVKESHSIMFTFDLLDEECVACLEKFEELHRSAAQQLGKFKGKVGLFDFNPEHPGSTFKNPIYWHRDTVTGERVKGKNPSLWVKLNHYRNNKTLFTDLNETPIDWSLLTEVEMKLLPLIQVEKIYVGGGKASLQLKLVSAVVVDVAPVGTRTRQTRTIDRLRKKRGGLADAVASQLATLRMEKQDSLDSGNLQPQTANLPSVPGQMHQIPTGSTNLQGTHESLENYLGGVQSQAPVQTQVQVHQQPQQQQPQVQQQQAPVQTNSVPTQINLQPSQQLQQTIAPTPTVQFNPQAQTQGHTVLQIQ